MRLSSYSCFRVALQKSQVMTSFRPPPNVFSWRRHCSRTSCFLQPILVDEIFLIRDLNPKKSNDHTDIHFINLKIAASIVAPILTILYNNCIIEEFILIFSKSLKFYQYTKSFPKTTVQAADPFLLCLRSIRFLRNVCIINYILF